MNFTYSKKFWFLLFLFGASLLTYLVVAKHGTEGGSGGEENREKIQADYSQFDFGGQKYPVFYITGNTLPSAGACTTWIFLNRFSRPIGRLLIQANQELWSRKTEP